MFMLLSVSPVTLAATWQQGAHPSFISYPSVSSAKLMEAQEMMKNKTQVIMTNKFLQNINYILNFSSVP